MVHAAVVAALVVMVHSVMMMILPQVIVTYTN
jgi:hypothetical protein